MSADKHRQAEIRQTVLDSVAIGNRTPEVERLLHTHGYGPNGAVGRAFDYLLKRGKIKVIRTGGRWGGFHRKTPIKSSARRHTNYRIADDPPAPGRARQERRGQTKPGGRQ